jgi:hypothetical protein
MIGAADRGFARSGAIRKPEGRERPFGLLSRKDLRTEMGTLPPVDIFPNQAPAHRLFQARNGTA